MKKNSGFTLLELLIALTLSAIILMGIQSVFSTVANTREPSLKASREARLVQALSSIVNRDLRQIFTDTFSVRTAPFGQEVTFTTMNSLFFNKTVPVRVTYSVEDGWLVRTEEQEKMSYTQTLPLLPDVEKIKVEYFNGTEYTDLRQDDTRILRFTFTVENNPVSVITARTGENQEMPQ